MAEKNAAGKEAVRLRNLELVAAEKEAARSLQHLKVVAKSEGPRLRNQVEVAEKEEERLWILLKENEPGGAARVRKLVEENGDAEVGGGDCPLGPGQSCEDSHGPQPNEDSQQRGTSLDKGNGPLEPRKDTPKAGEVKSTVLPNDKWPKLGEELAPDSEEPVRIAQSSSNDEHRTAQERSATDPEEPVQIAQSSPGEEYWSAQEEYCTAQEEQSNCSKLPTPIELPNPTEQLDSAESLFAGCSGCSQPTLINQSAPVQQLDPVKHSNTVKQPTPSKQLNPAGQPPPVERWSPASTLVEQSAPVEQWVPAEQPNPGPGPHNGPPIIRILRRYPSSQPQEQSASSTQAATASGSTLATQAGPATQNANTGHHNQTRPNNYRARRDARLAEERRMRAAQEAKAAQLVPVQLNPTAPPFGVTQAAEAAQSALDKQSNPAAQPVEATQSDSPTLSIASLQSDPEPPAISAWRSIPAAQPISSVWWRLAQALDSVYTLTESNILRRETDGPLAIGAYNKIHFGGPGRSMPKGEAYCKTLFRREPEPAPPGRPPPPVVHLCALPYPHDLIDDGFSLPPPSLSKFDTPYEQSSAQPVTEEEMLSVKPVSVMELLQRPNGRARGEPAESTPAWKLWAIAATREPPQVGEGESSARVDKRRDKRGAVVRDRDSRDYQEIRSLESWRKEQSR